jgi:hypothetical protein
MDLTDEAQVEVLTLSTIGTNTFGMLLNVDVF